MSSPRALPRLVIGGLSGGCGKTLVSLGIVCALRRAGVPVRAFKKGPDYIDAAWLRWASGEPARNLDTYLMGTAKAVDSFFRNAAEAGVNIIEGAGGSRNGRHQDDPHSSRSCTRLPDARSGGQHSRCNSEQCERPTA